MCSDILRVKIKKNPDKVVTIMADAREYLPIGTKIKLETGNIYEITGEPIGDAGDYVPAILLFRESCRRLNIG